MEAAVRKVEGGMRFPQIKHVTGTPAKDKAYVIPCVTYVRDGPDEIKDLAIGVKSPAYKSDGEPAPRGIHMTLSKSEAFARAILKKVRQAKRWNREQRKSRK